MTGGFRTLHRKKEQWGVGFWTYF